MDKSLGINIIDKIGQIINDPLNNQYLSTGILVLLVLYCGMLSTKLNNPVVHLLKNVYVKLILGIVIVATFKKNKAISLMLLVALVLTSQTSEKVNTANKISEAITNNNNLTENMLLNEQIQLIIDEESQKSEQDRLSSEEIVQVAEERVQNIIIEQTRVSENEIIPNEVTTQYSEAVPSEENISVQQENVVEENVVEENVVNEEIINKSLPAISRVMVEEEMKKEAVLPNQTEPTLISGFDKRLITEESLTSQSENVPSQKVPITKLSEGVDGFDKSSPLEEQIKNLNGTQLSTNNTRSSRGLNLNKKCNLCTLKKPEQDLSKVNAYEGDSLAPY